MNGAQTGAANREIDRVAQLAELNVSESGLVPVIAQDAESGAVLMMAWANREALTLTLETRVMHYWSRSRQALWKKGETSGNLQHLVSLHADCDRDTLLARVRTVGPACHTGDPTCFGALGDGDGGSGPAGGAGAGAHILDELWAVLEARDAERPEGSWTTRLLTDENLRLKKLGEETVELVSAILKQDGRAAEEAADLIYHLLVSLKGANVPWRDVLDELKGRRSAGS
jgi:phosphoribosyl-ATP pyrophosphohydrolase/phosphoribosyl-AMP cyclohydrolase